MKTQTMKWDSPKDFISNTINHPIKLDDTICLIKEYYIEIWNIDTTFENIIISLILIIN